MSGREEDAGGLRPASPPDPPPATAVPLPESLRLRFRAWTDADLPLARQLWGDAEVTRYLARGRLPEDAIRQRLERERSGLARHGYQYWPMFLKETGVFVGCCGLKVCPYEGTPDLPELELGFHLVPAMWGRGLATEAARAAACIAFDHLGAPRVFAGHHPDNRASQAVLRKLGFRYARDVLFEPTGLMHPLYVLEPGRLAR